MQTQMSLLQYNSFFVIVLTHLNEFKGKQIVQPSRIATLN